MASAKYGNGVVAIGTKTIDLVNDTIKIALVGSGYTFSQSHQFYSDINPASNTIGTPVAFTGKSLTATGALAVYNATSPVTFTSVTGATVTFLLIFKDTGTTTTSPLLAYLDAANGTGLPITPNGGNISIILDSGNNKMFSLG